MLSRSYRIRRACAKRMNFRAESSRCGSSSPVVKNISIPFRPKSPVYFRPSCPTQGAARDRHGRGAGCDGRGCAADERRVKRTAKSCGPDAPTLASSPQEAKLLRAMVAKKPGHQGEHEAAVKTIAQGRPGCSGEPVVTCSCALFFCTRGCGCIARPAFPAPFVWGMKIHGQLGRCASREGECMTQRAPSFRDPRSADPESQFGLCFVPPRNDG